MRSIPVLLAAACATAGPRYGSIAIKSGANAAARPVSYSVGKGTVSGSDLQASVDQGCVRGSMGGTPIQFCSDPANPNHWSGGSGDFTAIASEDGHAVQVDGYLTVGPGRQYSMTQAIRLGEGPQWDELRKNPALLAIAATAADLQAARIPH
jgi:hypothetical protein